MTKFDVVIIGAGHNGLVAANYLAMNGKSVCVVESRDLVGGACVTENLVGEAQFSSCAYVLGMLRSEVIEDLKLDLHGLLPIVPDPQGLAHWSDGTYLTLGKDLDETLKGLEGFSRSEAQGFISFGTDMLRFNQLTKSDLLSDPPTLEELKARFTQAGRPDLFQNFIMGSVSELMGQYFTDDRLRGYMGYLGMISIFGGPDTPTSAYVYGYHAAGELDGVVGRMAVPRGAMGAITQSLASAAEERGVVIRTQAHVDQILVTDGRATGVSLKGGEEIKARVVVSNAHPNFTLKNLLPQEAQDQAKPIPVETLGTMARIHLLLDKLPKYVGLEDAEGWPYQPTAILNASETAFRHAAEAQKAGELADELVVEAMYQSVLDPELAPKGQYTLTLGVQHLPFELSSGSWADRKEDWAESVIDQVEKHAPGLRGSINGRFILTPDVLEKTYGLKGGNIFHRSMIGTDNLFSKRVSSGETPYRTRIPGLYMCGSGEHPGGGVTGAPGHNAAKRVLADFNGDDTRQQRGQVLARPNLLVDKILPSKFGKRMSYEMAKRKTLRPVMQFLTDKLL